MAACRPHHTRTPAFLLVPRAPRREELALTKPSRRCGAPLELAVINVGQIGVVVFYLTYKRTVMHYNGNISRVFYSYVQWCACGCHTASSTWDVEATLLTVSVRFASMDGRERLGSRCACMAMPAERASHAVHLHCVQIRRIPRMQHMDRMRTCTRGPVFVSAP